VQSDVTDVELAKLQYKYLFKLRNIKILCNCSNYSLIFQYFANKLISSMRLENCAFEFKDLVNRLGK
jgi:hypothetical protein